MFSGRPTHSRSTREAWKNQRNGRWRRTFTLRRKSEQAHVVPHKIVRTQLNGDSTRFEEEGLVLDKHHQYQAATVMMTITYG